MATEQEAAIIAEAAFRLAEKGHNLEYVVAEVRKAYTPLWRTDRYTEEEQKLMAELMIEEVRDSVKDYAHDELDQFGSSDEDKIEVDGYIIEADEFQQLHQWSDGMDVPEPDADLQERAVRLGMFVRGPDGKGLAMTDYGLKFWQRWM